MSIDFSCSFVFSVIVSLADPGDTFAGGTGGTYIIIYQKVGACLSAPATFRLCLGWTQYCFMVCCRSEDESEEDSPSDHSQDQDDLPLGTKLKVRYGRGRNQKIYEAKVRSVGGASFQHTEWC